MGWYVYDDGIIFIINNNNFHFELNETYRVLEFFDEVFGVHYLNIFYCQHLDLN